MDALVISSAGVCVAVALGVVYGLRRSSSGCQLPATTDWIDELSVERYRPMLKLLSGEGVAFLRRQPDHTSAMEREFRAQRCQIFLGYLRNLEEDFGRVCGALKLLMMHAEQDRPDLVATLVRTRFQFTCGVAAARVQAQLFRCGLGTVDVADLLKIFTSLHLELRVLVPAGAGAMA
jgi:hypothetical protein